MAYRYVRKKTKRAKKTKGFTMVPKGKKPPIGEGGRFKALKGAIAARGKAREPGAVAATIGRRKFGPKRFARMAAAGRKGAGRKGRYL